LIDVVDAVEHGRAQLEQRTEAPGTNSARWTRISIVEGAMRTVTPAAVARVDELDRLLLREVRVGDDHLLHAVGVDHLAELVDAPERAQARCRAGAAAR
jgi:hypothetical protein